MKGCPYIVDKQAILSFRALEFAPSVQVVAYQMAIYNGVEVLPLTLRTPHASTKYFQTHKG